MQADGSDRKPHGRSSANQQNGGTRLISISARPLHAPPTRQLGAPLASYPPAFTVEAGASPPKAAGPLQGAKVAT